MDAAQGCFIAGTVVLMAAGGLHVAYALTDRVRPTYFAPVEGSVKPAMEGTTIRLARRFGATRSMWRIWIGINIGFGLGLFAFGLLCLTIVLEDFDLVERIDSIRPLSIAFPAAFLAVALRFFFYGPVLITASATACFSLAAVLSA
ncbi:MAG TPA: hypothetical protein VHG69_10880 [Thermoleophilaceae bacterium]|nr:hypothetical protein [Thermoleophilaceae bacterium]